MSKKQTFKKGDAVFYADPHDAGRLNIGIVQSSTKEDLTIHPLMEYGGEEWEPVGEAQIAVTDAFSTLDDAKAEIEKRWRGE